MTFPLEELLQDLQGCAETYGAKVDLSEIAEMKADELLFSEAPARALLATGEPDAVLEILKDVPHT